jgi:8-oxo-dGTP diphosphatase
VAPPRALNLHAFRVRDWSGEPRALEHQALAWVRPADLIRYPMPAPDRPIRARLALPPQYLITPEPNAAAIDAFVERFARAIEHPALGLVSLRAKSLAPDALPGLAEKCLARARAQRPDLIVLIHGALDLARSLGFDGAHLSSRQLRELSARPLPESQWVFASCHSPAELRAAQALLADAATLSPLQPTPLHPHSRPLGWERFARAARASWLPLYALGGVGPRGSRRGAQRRRARHRRHARAVESPRRLIRVQCPRCAPIAPVAAIAVASRGIRTRCEQSAHRALLAILRGDHQRRDALDVHRIQFRSVRQ